MWKLNIIIFFVALLFLKTIHGEAAKSPLELIEKTTAKLSGETTESPLELVKKTAAKLSGETTKSPLELVKKTAAKLPGRIVNGTQAVLKQFPQQVSLRRSLTQAHFCGGSIITPEWILTAAHCMFLTNGKKITAHEILVIAGEIALKNSNRARQWSYVIDLIMHEDFDYDTLQNDVALLKLKKPFVFDPYVKPLPIITEPVESGTFCNVSGWGYPQYEIHVVSSYLMYVDVPILSFPECQKLLHEYDLFEGMYCAGYAEGGRDACQGDSGGGMVCNDKLTGVVSGGQGCAWPNLPGLYSDILHYTPWIKKFVKNLNHNFTVRAIPYNNALPISSPSFVVVFLVGVMSIVFTV